MSNVINIIGHLGRDAEARDTNGRPFLTFSVACSTGYGERKVTSWFQCALWRSSFDQLQPHLRKGVRVSVCGELTLRQFKARTGETRTSVDLRVFDLELLSSSQDSSGQSAEDDHVFAAVEPQPARVVVSNHVESPDDCPF